MHSNASSLGRMDRISIRMLQIWFEWIELAFEFFESRSMGKNLHTNASNPFQMSRICIQMLRLPIEWFKFTFECFEYLFKWLEFAFECFESNSKA